MPPQSSPIPLVNLAAKVREACTDTQDANQEFLKWEKAWDRGDKDKASDPEEQAGAIIRAITEYEREIFFEYTLNEARIQCRSKVYEIAKHVPKGAMLHLHFNAELHPQQLFQEARNNKHCDFDDIFSSNRIFKKYGGSTPTTNTKVEKGFFYPADQDWTCYRRNYFSVVNQEKQNGDLFNVRMTDPRMREFSLRKYRKDSGREVHHPPPKHQKPDPPTHPPIPHGHLPHQEAQNIRSRSGCWTCRKRRAKCDEEVSHSFHFLD